jgi:catechol 2,3-dioxygenase-like lactoylglutathione lyase family enzyme
MPRKGFAGCSWINSARKNNPPKKVFEGPIIGLPALSFLFEESPLPEYKKAYVTIMVEDLDRSVDFYHKLLGLYEDLRFGDSWAEMVTKGMTIGLHPKRPGAHPSPKHNHLSIGFEVMDIRKTAKELEEKGIAFQFQENEVNILAFFQDPDGTPLYLTQVR